MLSDPRRRARYDREGENNQTNHGSTTSNSTSGQDSSSVRRLKKRVVSLERQVSSLEREVDDTREDLAKSNSLLTEKERQMKQLQHKQKRIQNEIDFHTERSALLEDENRDQLRQIDIYERKIEKAGRELRDERRKSDDLARAEEKARNDIEHVKRVMSERSVCYRCNGEAIDKDDCSICQGRGAIQGLWTKCHNCDGKGSYTSISGGGEIESCTICNAKGAREGILSMPCFKCKGSKQGGGCSACYKGRIKGYNLQLCPICKGKELGGGRECENCFGKAFVSCRCGPVCKGHKSNRIAKPSTPSSLQRKLAIMHKEEKEREQDWVSTFKTRNWLLPI